MFAQALLAIVVATTLALAWLEMSAIHVTIAARHLAERYAVAALERAQNELMESVAGQITAGNVAGPFAAPTPGPAVAACPVAAPCPFQVTTSETIAGATQSGIVVSTTQSAAGNVVASNQQQNPGVGEQRIAAVVTATVSNASGGTLATALRSVVLRTFAAPPYVALSAVDEATAENRDVADFAGTCDGGSACGGNDNRIHALVRCVDVATPSNCNGVPDLPADAFTDTRWQNANAQPKSWSR